jgi:hypothetical protein
MKTYRELLFRLFDDPQAFVDRGDGNSLLKEHFNGMPVNVLKPLLRHSDPCVRGTAVFVANELGSAAAELIDDVVPLINDSKPYTQLDALESVLVNAVGDQARKFVVIVSELERQDRPPGIGSLVLSLMGKAKYCQIEAAIGQVDQLQAEHRDTHVKGLELLLEGKDANAAKIAAFLEHPDDLMQKYGAIAAKQLLELSPELLHQAKLSKNRVVANFATETLDQYLGVPFVPTSHEAEHAPNRRSTMAKDRSENETLQLARTCIEVYRELAALHAEAFRPDLATLLRNLSRLLQRAQGAHCGEASAAAQESVTMFRELAAQWTGFFLPELAFSLDTLREGCTEGLARSLSASQESTSIWRRLSEQQPGQESDQQPEYFLPFLGQSLICHATILSAFDRRGEAVNVAQEAVGIYRKLSKSRPAFLSSLALSLNNLGQFLGDNGQFQEALSVVEDAVKVYGVLFEESPEKFMNRFATSIANLADRILDLNLELRENGTYVAARELLKRQNVR